MESANQPATDQRASRLTFQRARLVISRRGFRISVSVGLLLFLIWHIDVTEMLTHVRHMHFFFIIPLFAIFLAIRLAAALRWHILLRAGNASISYWRVLRLLFVSYFIGYFTPGSIGIELARMYAMAKATTDGPLSVTSMAVERLFGLFALILLVLVGLASHPPDVPAEIGLLAWLALAVLILGTVCLMTRPTRNLTLWLCSCQRLLRIRRAVERIYLILDEYRTRSGLLLAVLTITLLIQLLRCAAPAIGAAAFGFDLSFMLFIILMPVVILLGLLPISIAGLGVRELSFVYLFGLVGIPAEVGLAIALLLRLVAMSTAVPGAWLYIRSGLHA